MEPAEILLSGLVESFENQIEFSKKTAPELIPGLELALVLAKQQLLIIQAFQGTFKVRSKGTT